jgi:hypothetical protein
MQDIRSEKKELRTKCIEKIGMITMYLNRTEGIINILLDFIDSDFNDKDYDEERNQNLHRLFKIYSQDFEYFWDTFITELYLFLPISTRTDYFRILNKIMNETKDLSERINDYLEGEDFVDGIKSLQKSFEYSKNKYLAALYAKNLLLEELQYNIDGRKNNTISKSFYAKHKESLLSAIE